MRSDERISRRTLWISSALFVLLFLAITVLPPPDFPQGRLVRIEEGKTVAEAGEILKEAQVISSDFVFKVAATSLGGIIAGDYFFERPVDVFTVAKRMSRGEYGLEPMRVLIREGLTVGEMAQELLGYFQEFEAEKFISLATDKEGYLFPDTYYFLPNTSEEQIIAAMEDNFDKKTESLEVDREIITMASIIEKEARKSEVRKKISGVLWNRLAIGMALQVDATLLYITGRNTFELTVDDLELDHPYNTYQYPGLPPGPICNPSLDSIEAALYPAESDNLYYLSDKKGNTYFTADFEEHKKNKFKYLR
jgi:UPF0755 protein